MLLCLALAWLIRPLFAAVPFELPFRVDSYDGYLEALSDDGTSGAVVYWKTDNSSIEVALAAAGSWVGFGMNEKTPSMQGADIVVCREHTAGAVSVADYVATRNGEPELDVVQDWVTLDGGRVHYSPPPPPSGACPSGWTWRPNKCYKVGAPASQANAKAACAADSGTLVSIANAAENRFVRELVFNDVPGASRALVWIGVDRADVNSQWKAPDGSTPLFTNWHSGRDAATGQYENCAVLGVAENSESPDEKWWSPDCRWSEPRYVCERPVESGTTIVDKALYEPRLPVTWCIIIRSRRTCDPTEDYQIIDLDVPIRGLLAWSSPSQVGDQLAYHGAGQRRQQLFAFSGAVADTSSHGLPSDATEEVFAPPTHTVSSAAGSFAYSYHKFNIESSKRYQVIKWRVAWNRDSPAGKAGLHHHMDLRACDGPVPGATIGGVLDAGLMMAHCNNNFLVGTATLPSDEGIPIGDGGPVYLAIERHFYNPVSKSGMVDYGAKFHVTYTAQLRPKEMSALQIGTLALKVPPQTYGFVMRSHCPPACTQKMGTIQATQVSFHAHGHTRYAALRVVRDGVELEPLAYIEPYDDALSTRKINRKILPGDELLLDCVYDNDLNKEIVYGDAIDDEMCWATLSVVGKNPVTTCLDYPDPAQNKWPTYDTDCKWCVHNNYFEAACSPCNVDIPFARCPGLGEDMGTGRVDDAFSRRGNPNAGNDVSVLKYLPFDYTQGSCDALSSDAEEVPATPGRCLADGQKVAGAKDCPFKWGGSLRISWETDCSAQQVRFDIEKSGGGDGWLAVGLHDAGSVTSPQTFPPTRMNGADIVQISPATNAIKDALGDDYKTPRPKSVAVATLLSSEVSGGRQRASFTRPFTSAEGVTLAEDRFVWLICAYRSSSSDLDAKHEQATALSRSRISLFGGVAESKRLSVTVVRKDNSSGGSSSSSSSFSPSSSSASSPSFSSASSLSSPSSSSFSSPSSSASGLSLSTSASFTSLSSLSASSSGGNTTMIGELSGSNLSDPFSLANFSLGVNNSTTSISMSITSTKRLMGASSSGHVCNPKLWLAVACLVLISDKICTNVRAQATTVVENGDDEAASLFTRQ
eukprot:TRINITY_DN4136_c0_g4_i1.p1 TRINITY_DN4136_c0_g4~~TRINITY_DN4136_c0_g4_i1.p1  ORF type:complete len:1096 (+),score=132.72 TRINITY_DN4136_c0_g4_i1:72-3359(+)